ncbi:hypothetical protein [Maribacter sp. UBA4516]|uniref:hypothetical protein n=1 Tax=Maribacter sp. UBA4516 TaxID=1946804 RepID=UPI00257AB298|nr:hypothetical protein [Maribacter sp. UBA4516]|tara:strand:+ start:1695 stop:2129 length:435 start_codon:yes stop_codon:yes gene_type:complete
MRKEYKYQADIDEITKVCNCPNSEYFSFGEKEAFRFVFEDINHPNNFSPPAKIKPARYLSKSEREKCDGLGLSLYANKNGARNKFNELITTFKNFKKIIGTHIAIGTITDDDGHITPEDEITHFDLYEYTSSTIETKFNIIEEL